MALFVWSVRSARSSRRERLNIEAEVIEVRRRHPGGLVAVANAFNERRVDKFEGVAEGLRYRVALFWVSIVLIFGALFFLVIGFVLATPWVRGNSVTIILSYTIGPVGAIIGVWLFSLVCSSEAFARISRLLERAERVAGRSAVWVSLLVSSMVTLLAAVIVYYRIDSGERLTEINLSLLAIQSFALAMAILGVSSAPPLLSVSERRATGPVVQRAVFAMYFSILVTGGVALLALLGSSKASLLSGGLLLTVVTFVLLRLYSVRRDLEDIYREVLGVLTDVSSRTLGARLLPSGGAAGDTFGACVLEVQSVLSRDLLGAVPGTAGRIRTQFQVLVLVDYLASRLSGLERTAVINAKREFFEAHLDQIDDRDLMHLTSDFFRDLRDACLGRQSSRVEVADTRRL